MNTYLITVDWDVEGETRTVSTFDIQATDDTIDEAIEEIRNTLVIRIDERVGAELHYYGTVHVERS